MSNITIESPNHSFSQLCADEGVLREMSDIFCFMPEGYKFTPAYKMGMWNGEIRLLHRTTGMIPKGLTPELLDALESSGHDYKLDPSGFAAFSNKLTRVDVEDLKLGFEPHDFQLAAVDRVLEKKRQIILSPTGSGKSLILYMLVRSLEDKNILIIVPNISLVSQLFSDFKDYSQHNGWDVESNVHTISEGAKKDTSKQIVISTWQSIFNQPSAWFHRFEAVLGDEVHTFKAKSLSSIMEKSKNAWIRCGVSGTLDGAIVNEMVLKGHFGPIHRVASTSELMDRGILSALQIKAIVLRHPLEACKTFGKVQYIDEMDYLVRNIKRNKFITGLANSTNGNTLVLFQYVEKHGKQLKVMMEETCKEKQVYFVYGGTPGDTREQIRKLVESKSNAIIIASYAVYSTGINIKNLHNIIFASPSKGRIRIFQSIGRGLRLHETKEMCKLYDIADDLRGTRKALNHTLRHFTIRMESYMSEQFNVKTVEIDL